MLPIYDDIWLIVLKVLADNAHFSPVRQ